MGGGLQCGPAGLTTALPDPYPALACGNAEIAYMAVGHRVLLSTPLGTHEAPMREEALHLQIERDGTGPRVQTDQDRVLVTLTGKDIDLVLGVQGHVGAAPPHGGVAFPQGDVSKVITIYGILASHERRRHVWLVYSSTMYSRAQQSSWI